MDPFSMVVAIVGITAVASVLRARYGSRKDAKGNEIPIHYADTARTREDMKALKDRVAVLERLATDDTSRLDREIDQLRDRI